MQFLSPAWLLLLIRSGCRRRLRRPPAAPQEVRGPLQQRRAAGVCRAEAPGMAPASTFALLHRGLTVLSIGVARPTAAVRVPRDRATVMMAIDVSESMQANDVLPSRLQAAQQAAKQFADLLPPRINLGLVKFGGAASVLVPPTTDRDAVKAAIDGLELDRARPRSAKPSSPAWTRSRCSASTTAGGDKPPPARIVLMSDGRPTTGPCAEAAAAAAAEAKVAGLDDRVRHRQRHRRHRGRAIPVPADKATLSGIAQTGGTFHTAASEAELQRSTRTSARRSATRPRTGTSAGGSC